MGALFKALLFIALLAGVVIWLRQAGRRRGQVAPPPPSPPAAPPPASMVACRHCDLRLPAAEACRGALGWYCGEPHRRGAGDGPPAP